MFDMSSSFANSDTLHVLFTEAGQEKKEDVNGEGEKKENAAGGESKASKRRKRRISRRR